MDAARRHAADAKSETKGGHLLGCSIVIQYSLICVSQSMTTEQQPKRRSKFGRGPFGGCAVVLSTATFVIVVTGFVWYRFATGWDVGEPFDVHRFVSVSVPGDQNAFTYYREAHDRFVNEPAGFRSDQAREAFSKSCEEAIDGGWGRADEQVRDWLLANRPALDVWKRGTECADALPVPLAELTLATVLPVCQSLREFARPALLEAARVSAEKSPAEAWTWYRAVLRSSRHDGMHSATIGRMIGTALYSLAAEPVLRWSARSELTAGDLRHVLADVLAIDKMTPPVSDNLKAEYLVCREAVEANSAGWSGLPMRLTVYPERMRRALNLIFANWLSQANRPRFRQTPSRGKWMLFEPDPAAPPNPKVLPPAEIEKRCGVAAQSTEAVMMSLLMPSMIAFFESIDRERTRQAALVLGLSLQLYHREHGQFPATLDELVKGGYLKSIPADPFGKGEPFHYRREADPLQGAILWSVWTDGIDQNGKIEVSRDREGASGDKVFRIASPRKVNP
jgi:hypothetical protein